MIDEFVSQCGNDDDLSRFATLTLKCLFTVFGASCFFRDDKVGVLVNMGFFNRFGTRYHSEDQHCKQNNQQNFG